MPATVQGRPRAINVRDTRTRARTLVVSAAAALTLAGCGGLEQSQGPEAASGSLAESVDLEGASYTVGGKDFDEQLVLCEMAIAALESVNAEVTNQCSTGGTEVARNALLGGEIDMYWEYTGTAWVQFFQEEPIQNEQEQYTASAERDQQENNIRWLTPTQFNNTYAFAVLESEAAELGLETLSDMARYYRDGGRGKTCMESEYLNRSDGWPGMRDTYDVRLPGEPTVLQTGAIYEATADPNRCLFGLVFTTDGRIPALNLRVLEDDRVYHPIYNAAITIRQEAFDQNPDIERVFEPIANALTNEVMLELNARKSAENVSERQVARDWLREQGFIGTEE